jgi:hypothetical protein
MPSEIISITQHRRTSVSGRTPALSSIREGELAVNITDGKIFLKTPINELVSFYNHSYYEDVMTIVQTNSAAWINGVDDVVVNVDSASWKTDFVNNANYIGKALPGTSEDASAWYIKKITLNTAGSVISTTSASVVSWNDRLTANYI